MKAKNFIYNNVKNWFVYKNIECTAPGYETASASL